MPRCDPDDNLLKGVAALVDACDGNESEAARRMGVPRLKVNRLIKKEGRATKPVRTQMWAGLKAATDMSGENVALKDQKQIQVIQDVPAVAIQVLRYMTEAVESRGAVQAGMSADASNT